MVCDGQLEKASGNTYVLQTARVNPKMLFVLFSVCSLAFCKRCHPSGPRFGPKENVKKTRWLLCSPPRDTDLQS